MIPEKVRRMLSAGDLEEAQLGLLLLKEFTPKGDIPLILDEFLNKDFIYTKDEEDLRIRDYNEFVVDLWSMKQKVNTPLMNMVSVANNIILTDTDTYRWELPLSK